MMTLFSLSQLVKIAVLLIHISSAAADFGDVCDSSIYGQPSYADCVDILYGTRSHRGAAIFNLDDHDHGFFLPYFGSGSRFTITQWRHRVELPRIWHNDGCRIALVVKPSPTGDGFTTDSGTWLQIAARGKALLDYCLLTKQVTQRYSGGVGDAGVTGGLNIVIYAQGSSFDRALNGIRGPGDGPVGVDYWNKTIAGLRAGGRIGNISLA